MASASVTKASEQASYSYSTALAVEAVEQLAIEQLADQVIEREDRLMELATRLSLQRETWRGLETIIGEVIQLVDGLEVKAGGRYWRVAYVRDTFARKLYFKPARPVLETTSRGYSNGNASWWGCTTVVDPQNQNGTWKLFEDNIELLTHVLTK